MATKKITPKADLRNICGTGLLVLFFIISFTIGTVSLCSRNSVLDGNLACAKNEFTDPAGGAMTKKECLAYYRDMDTAQYNSSITNMLICYGFSAVFLTMLVLNKK